MPPLSLTDHERRALETLVDEYVATLDDHVSRLVDRLQAEIAEYAAVPADDVAIASGAIARSVLNTILDGHVAADGVAALDELARRRVAQGFPLEALTRSIQVGARFVADDLAERVQAAGLPASGLLVVQDAAWRFASDAAVIIAAVHREFAEDLARRDTAHRSDFLRALLHGAMDVRRIQAEAALYGLDPKLRYHPLRARPADEQQELAMAMAIRRSGATLSHRPVIGVLEGELVGLAPQRPVLEDGAVALGEACDLADARDSFLATRPLLDAALAFGHAGVLTLSDLGPTPLALEASDLARALEQQHFAGVEGNIEDTVRVLLELDQDVDAAATKLHVHPNTVRYRLGRFREITELDPRRTNDLVITWWLLTRRAARVDEE